MFNSPYCRLVLLTCLLAFAGMRIGHALEPDKLFELVSPSVFLVVTFDKHQKRLGNGSGVVVGPEQVITNCHVLAKSSSVRLVRNNESYSAVLEHPDPERDLCQLKVPNLKAPAVKLGRASAVKVGQRVYAVGAPKGYELTLSDGLVSSLRDTKQGAPQIQTSAPVSPGSSGGGLFDVNGLLVGIITWQERDSQNLNFAYPAEWIAQVPERGKANLAKLEERSKPVAVSPGGTALPPVDHSLPQHMPQVGDTWTYALVDVRFNPSDRKKRFVHTIIESKPTAITETIGRSGSGNVIESSYGSAMEAYYRIGILELAPFYASFNELTPGKTWRNIRIGEGENNALAAVSPISLSSGRVLGQETIRVPAGQFTSVKSRFEGDIARLVIGNLPFPNAREPLYVTVWYAHEVKRPVKILMETTYTTDAYELESYRIR
jgi:hypothetical protein